MSWGINAGTYTVTGDTNIYSNNKATKVVRKVKKGEQIYITSMDGGCQYYNTTDGCISVSYIDNNEHKNSSSPITNSYNSAIYEPEDENDYDGSGGHTYTDEDDAPYDRDYDDDYDDDSDNYDDYYDNYYDKDGDSKYNQIGTKSVNQYALYDGCCQYTKLGDVFDLSKLSLLRDLEVSFTTSGAQSFNLPNLSITLCNLPRFEKNWNTSQIESKLNKWGTDYITFEKNDEFWYSSDTSERYTFSLLRDMEINKSKSGIDLSNGTIDIENILQYINYVAETRPNEPFSIYFSSYYDGLADNIGFIKLESVEVNAIFAPLVQPN